MSDTTRRAVLAGAAGVTAVTVLAACGDDGGSTDGPGSTTGATTPETTGAGTPGAAVALAKTADIPVGGGRIFQGGGGVVVTQPKAGEFKAFTAICTHQGCTVADVAGGTINCGCHGSKYSVEDGPATRPLAAKEITVDGDSITLA